MTMPALLAGRLTLPVIAAPMFIASGPELVIAACKAGIVGTFPALNARPQEALAEWLQQIKAEVGDAPYAVNLIVHNSNTRLDRDLATCVEQRVPMIITSLRPPSEVIAAVHGYGGLVFHDVVNVRHAEKAIEEGVDGLIAVCAGAGGHAGTLSPFALLSEIRRIWSGPLVLSGAIVTGRSILSAQALGADLAYMGTLFIATRESNSSQSHKDMIVATAAKDVVYTPYFSGVHANYLRPSIVASGLDPDALPAVDKSKMSYAGRDKEPVVKAWRDVWGAGQGVGQIDDIPTVGECVSRLKSEYEEALADLTRRRF